MLLQINQSTYNVSLKSQVTSQGEMVIIDETGEPFSRLDNHRLIILFDQARTARWFALLIVERLSAGQDTLRIQKTPHWDSNFPMGYSYNEY